MKKIIFIGASGHGKVAADIAKKIGYTDVSFLDDSSSALECNGYPVIGKSKDAFFYPNSDFFVSIGNSKIREKMMEMLSSAGLKLATLVHPNAVIGENVSLGEGTIVMAGAVINPCVKIGRGCIVNTCASVDHDCEIADFVHVSVGAHVAGTVKIGEGTWLGIGAVVSNNLNIASQCTIGAGAVVVKDITETGIYIGVPARKMN